MTKKARPYSLLIVYSKAIEETEMVLALEFMRKYVGTFEMRPLQWWAESVGIELRYLKIQLRPQSHRSPLWIYP